MCLCAYFVSMLTSGSTSRRRAALLAAAVSGLVLTSGTALAAVAPERDTIEPTPPAGRVIDLTLDSDDAGLRTSGQALTLDRPAPPGHDTRTGNVQREVALGSLVDTPHTFDEPVGAVGAAVEATTPPDGTVTVDVRGRIGTGTPGAWTEWVPAGEDLPEVVTTVQARVTLTAARGTTSPAVRKVTLLPRAATTGAPASTAHTAPGTRDTQAAAQTYRIYATREGLVGGTTANGHVIKTRDHFVALPSRRGLAPRNTGTYSVRVCSDATGRCAYAPVWDVGPWNITDDYWNVPATRESWADLPQGRPQAQAAYQDGYNGGRDGFGRAVLNPAGIDLADGTFWDGVGLSDNGWVNVSYLWTGSGPTGIVRTGSGGPLNVRSGPGTSNAVVGKAGHQARVIVECTARGETVTGTYGTSNLWNRIGAGNWVPDVYLYTGSDDPVAPAC